MNPSIGDQVWVYRPRPWQMRGWQFNPTATVQLATVVRIEGLRIVVRFKDGKQHTLAISKIIPGSEIEGRITYGRHMIVRDANQTLQK